MSVVLDSSATLAWIYPDEVTPAVADLTEQINEAGAWVPTIWSLEVGNNLLLAVRHKRVRPHHRTKALEYLSAMNISIDPDTASHAWRATSQLAEQFRLTLYDACYLELAQRRALPLASLDKDLRAAGKKLGVELLGM